MPLFLSQLVFLRVSATQTKCPGQEEDRALLRALMELEVSRGGFTPELGKNFWFSIFHIKKKARIFLVLSPLPH